VFSEKSDQFFKKGRENPDFGFRIPDFEVILLTDYISRVVGAIVVKVGPKDDEKNKKDDREHQAVAFTSGVGYLISH
jgi:hypothetical protein